MNIKDEVFKTLERTSGEHIMELAHMSADEIYEFAKKDIAADGADVPDFSNLRIKDMFYEVEPVISHEMEEAARQWLKEKGMDEMRTEILCHIFIMGLATHVIQEKVSNKPILH